MKPFALAGSAHMDGMSREYSDRIIYNTVMGTFQRWGLELLLARSESQLCNHFSAWPHGVDVRLST